MKYDFDRVIERQETESEKWKKFAPDVLPMWVADMDFLSPPEVTNALVQRAQHGIFGYTVRSRSYYNSIVDWMRTRHGWETRHAWYAHSPGVVTALNLAVNAFTQPGDEIIIQPPVYTPFFVSIKNNGRHIVQNPLYEEKGYYRMDLAHLERHIGSRTKALILCSPHNPIGRVWTKEELGALAEICVRRNILIFSDEIHSDLILYGHKHTPLAMLAPEIADITVTFVAPSKTFNIPGLFTSALIIPNPKLHIQFDHMRENLSLHHTNIFGMVGFDAAYRYGEKWLEQLLEYLQGNIDYTLRFFKERIPQIKIACPEATYLLWLDCRGLGLSPDALLDLFLNKAKVGLNEGRAYGAGGEGFMRMNVGCPRATLQEGLARIERAVNGS